MNIMRIIKNNADYENNDIHYENTEAMQTITCEHMQNMDCIRIMEIMKIMHFMKSMKFMNILKIYRI